MVDLEDAEESHFKVAVLYGKGKLDEYWDILMSDISFYYPAVGLHPVKKLAWFKDKWRRYPAWPKTVESDMKELVAS